MIFALLLIVLFVGTSVYLFFRSENFEHELILSRKELRVVSKENETLIGALTLVAGRHEEIAKHRLNHLKDVFQGNDDKQRQLNLMIPLVNNYAMIFRETIKGKAKMSAIAKRCFDSVDENAYRSFTMHLAQQNKQIQRAWGSDNLSGFILLVDALFISIESGAVQKKSA